MSKANRTCDLDDVGKVLQEYLYQFGVATYIAMEDGTEMTANDTKNFMKKKSISPTGEGRQKETKSGKTTTVHYRTAYRVYKPKKRKADKGDDIWRVVGSRSYQLDHLLEDGHVVKNHKNGSNLPIHAENRVKSSVKSAHYDDEYHTTQFDMWENGYKHAEEKYVGNVLKALNQMLKG